MSHYGPPPADYPLDADGVARVLSRQFPELAGLPVTFIGEGFDSRAFRVGGEWIFRFPKRAEVQTWLHKERDLLPQIAPQLPLPVPRFEWLGQPDADVMYEFVGYRALPGVPCDRLPPADHVQQDPQAAGRQLGEFLRALHAVPTTVATACGAKVGPPADVNEMMRKVRGALPAVQPHATANDMRRFAAFVDHAADLLHATADLPPCLVHYDLLPEHILLDPATGHLSGIIDWGDVGIAHPAVDLAAAFIQPGLTDAPAAMHAYGASPELADRARAVACCAAVLESRWGRNAADSLRRAALAANVLRHHAT